MPVLFVREGHREPWKPTTIRALGKNEEYLESLIGTAPELLGLEDLRTHVQGPYAAFHQLGVETPAGQTVAPDIVFLTQSGHIVVVEVKLADNEELRGRKVIAQVVEYAASIATYDELELVQLFDAGLPTDARFSDVVRKHLPSAPDAVALAAELIRKIRAAEIHLVIACDHAPEGLREFVASVTAQQALGNYELRVCELVPFVGAEPSTAGMLLVPSSTLRTEVVARTVVEVNSNSNGGLTFSARVTPQDEVQARVAAATAAAGTVRPRITPDQFFEAMAKRNAQLPEKLRRFLEQMEAFGAYPEYLRSLNVRWEHEGRMYTLVMIQPDGQVWTDSAGSCPPLELSRRYVDELAAAVKGEVEKRKLGGKWFVTINGKPPRIEAIADRLDVWARIARDHIERLKVAANADSR